MPRPRAVMATFDRWGSSSWLGGHHLAQGLVTAGWDVAFVSWPMSTLHLWRVTSREVRTRFAIHRAGGISHLDGHLWEYVPAALLTPHNLPLLRNPWLHRNWHRLAIPPVARALRDRGFDDVDLLYVDAVIHAGWLDQIRARRSLLRVPDRLAGFPGRAPALRRLEAQIAPKVDLVAYAASGLADHVRSLGARRAIHLPNGVDFESFRRPSPIPDDLTGIARPIALYLGSLEPWFDFELLNQLTLALPEVSFVLVGPDHLAQRRLEHRSNLHLLGARSHCDVPAYVQHADLGLIPFDIRGHADFVSTVHPLKLYEYLAAGLPVVATAWPELRRISSPAVLCETVEEHVAAIRTAIAQPGEVSARLEFARAADWSRRLRLLLDELDL